MKKLNVKVNLGKKATADVILAEKPDAVILAQGAAPTIPNIPGIEKAVTAADVLVGKAKVGNEVIVAGGGLVGCEVALHLAESGKKVTIVSASPAIAQDASVIIMRWDLLERLAKAGVQTVTGLSPAEVTDHGVVFEDKTWQRKTIKADTMVIAKGYKPIKDGLAEALEGKVPEVYSVGDCVQVGNVKSAVHSGSQIARHL
jgi:2-enoate reductase